MRAGTLTLVSFVQDWYSASMAIIPGMLSTLRFCARSKCLGGGGEVVCVMGRGRLGVLPQVLITLPVLHKPHYYSITPTYHSLVAAGLYDLSECLTAVAGPPSPSLSLSSYLADLTPRSYSCS